MTNALYDRFRATADRMLEKYGMPVTITKTALSGAVTTIVTKAVRIGTVKHALGDGGPSIGDDRYLVEAIGNPQPGDRIQTAEYSRVIIDPVDVIAPGGTVIAYECYARGG